MPRNKDRVIQVVQHGNFKKLDSYLEKIKETIKMGELNKIGREGVEALKAATPRRTGLTAESWYYKIERTPRGDTKIIWCNSNVVNDYANVAILIQYGHATKDGGYVEGIDYINPALEPIFKKLSQTAWEVIKQ